MVWWDLSIFFLMHCYMILMSARVWRTIFLTLALNSKSNPRRNFLGFLILFYSLQDQSNQPCTPTASTFSLLVTPQTGLNKERRHYLENRQCIFIYILFYFTYICILYALNNIFISHFKNRNEITSFT